MVGAAVGFQCPECVKQGAKQTRSGRAAYGGQRSTNPQLTSVVLIAVNVLVWLLLTGDHALRSALSLLPAGRCEVLAGSDQYYPNIHDAADCAVRGAAWVPGVADGAIWQVVTSAFAHVAITHLAFNMVALYFLGPMLEVALGRARFLAVYAVSGLAGAALVMLAADPASETLGASGAIFGLMGGLVVLALKVHADLQTIGFWLVLNLAFTFTNPGISWQGHIGGLVGGAAATAAIVWAPRTNRSAFQWSALTLLAALALVLIGLRGATL